MVGVPIFVDEGLGHSSYLVELGDGAAVITDRPRFAAGPMCGPDLAAPLAHDMLAAIPLVGPTGIAHAGGADSWAAATGRPLAMGR